MAKIERTKNATRNIVFGVILKAYQILVPFLMRTAMIYLMGVQYLGLNSLFTSVLQVLNLAELGVGSAMIYSMYRPIAEDDDEKICALMKLYRTYYRAIGLVIAIVGCILTFCSRIDFRRNTKGLEYLYFISFKFRGNCFILLAFCI